MNINIDSVFRLKKKPKTDQGLKPEPSKPAPLIVDFKYQAFRDAIVSSAKDLSRIEQYENVFIRPYRTPAEQSDFNLINKERREANEDLKRNGKLDNPYRFVIRGDRVRCINVEESQKINGFNKHSYVEWKIANAARRS